MKKTMVDLIVEEVAEVILEEMETVIVTMIVLAAVALTEIMVAKNRWEETEMNLAPAVLEIPITVIRVMVLPAAAGHKAMDAVLVHAEDQEKMIAAHVVQDLHAPLLPVEDLRWAKTAVMVVQNLQEALLLPAALLQEEILVQVAAVHADVQVLQEVHELLKANLVHKEEEAQAAVN